MRKCCRGNIKILLSNVKLHGYFISILLLLLPPLPLSLRYTSKTKKLDADRIIIHSAVAYAEKAPFFSHWNSRGGAPCSDSDSLSSSPFRKLVFYRRIFRLLIPRFNGARDDTTSMYQLKNCIIAYACRSIHVAHGLSEERPGISRMGRGSPSIGN